MILESSSSLVKFRVGKVRGIKITRFGNGFSLPPPYFLARRPGGGVTELRTHEQGLVGAIGVQMDYLTPTTAATT